MKRFLFLLLCSVGVIAQTTPYGQPVRLVAGYGDTTTPATTVTPYLVTNISLNVDTTVSGVSAGDVLTPVREIANVVRATGETAELRSITLFNQDDENTPALSLILSAGALTWAATNAVATFDNVQIRTSILGIINVATTDWKDLGTNFCATFSDIGIGIKPVATSLYVYGICNAAITNTNGMFATFTFRKN